ncbi:MAG: hypothetical protein HRT45_17245, partial [Bdellovibrionales bacterium]|nr:hypothetical protein [Bdellovibrionales bacterium]
RGRYNMILTPELKPMIDKNKAKIGPDGKLTYKGTVILNRKARGGIVQAAVKISPVNPPFPLGDYEGLHDVGEFDQILGLRYAQQSRGAYTEESFNYSDFLENQTTNFAELKNSRWAMELPPVRFSPLTPRFVRVNGGETATMREITFRTTTRATDSITGKPLADELFTIKRSYDGVEVPVEATENGLLRWMDEISHLYYETEKYVFPTVSIQHDASESKQDIRIAINPWDFGWTFGDDTRGQESFYDELAAREVKPNTLFIDAFRYQTIRFRYEIDPYMTLNVKKAVVMAMDPLVQRTTIQRGRIFEPLRDGIYLAKVALVKYFIDPFQNGTHLYRDPETNEHYLNQVREGGEFKKGQYTTVIKKLIRVQAGRITTPLEFSMRDLRMMSIRSQIMVQLETVDEKKLLRDNTVEGKIRELYQDYLALNDPGNNVTPEQREAFFAEKEALFEAEMAGLRAKMEEELEILKEQRIARGEAQAGQFRLYEDLEDAIASIEPSALRGQYEELMNAERQQFNTRMQEFRDRLQEMHERMAQYWENDYSGRWAHLGFEDGLPPVPLRVGAPPPANPYGPEGGYDRERVEERLNAPFGQEISDQDVLCNEDEEACRQRGMRFNEQTVSYYDYLSVMQSFITDVGLPGTIGRSDYDAFELNNYTANPAAPFIDLNLYRNRSGLIRRTFIGPCTLVANDNMSEMRATDTIDEKYCDSIDCQEDLYEPLHPPADNTEFEESAHHDSLKPFTNMHVDEVVEMHIANEETYEKTMMITSQLGPYSDKYNFDYTSMTNQPIKEFIPGCQYDGPIADFESAPECFRETQDTVISATDRVEAFKVGENEVTRLIQEYFYLHGWTSLMELDQPEQTDSELTRMSPYWDQVKRHMSRILTVDYLTSKADHRDPRTAREVGDRSDPFTVRAGNHYIKEHLDSEIPGFSAEDIDRWLKDGLPGLSLVDAVRLCASHSERATELLSSGGHIVSDAVASEQYYYRPEENHRFTGKAEQMVYKTLAQRCLEQIVYLPESKKLYLSAFSFDRRWRIHKTGPYQHIAGKNMNLNVGIDFGVTTFNNSHDVVQTGVAAIPAMVAVFGLGGAIIGSVVPVLGTGIGAAVGSFAGGVIGSLVFSLVQEDVEGVSTSISTAVSAATFLVVQKAEMEIQIFEHEKCLTSQFTPNFVSTLPERLDRLLKPGINQDQDKYNSYILSLSKGMMICDGKVTMTYDEPEKIYENYYYVTQHFTAGDMLDEVNLLNHVWLLALRGDRDYNKFLQMLQARPIDSAGEVIPDKSVFNYPLYRLGKIYDQVTPSFPGIYSLPE